MSLTSQTTIGIIWNFGEQLARRGMSVVITLLLARFLAPEDYGLVAMMSVFLVLGTSLMESGFREALIRLESVTQEDYSTAFYANILIGLLAYSTLYVLAPRVAIFYEEPRLVELIRVASIAIIITSFQVVQIANLNRKLNFKTQFKASLPANAISGIVAVLLAYSGLGVWALVAQIIINVTIQTALLWSLHDWRPTRNLSWPSLKGMYNFGYKLFLSGVIDTLFQNLYIIVIAKLFSAPIAGLYFFADKIKQQIITLLVTSIQKVAYPALASVQNDSVRLKQGFKRIVILLTLLHFPIILFTAALAEPIFQLLLPDKWLAAAPYFQLLCISALMTPLHSINLNILKVKGRSDLFLYLEIFKKLISILVLLITYRYGVYAIIFGQICTSMINYVPNCYYSKKLLNYGIKEQVQNFFPTLFTSLFSAGLGFCLVTKSTLGNLQTVSLAIIAMTFTFIVTNLLINKKNVAIAKQVLSTLLKDKFKRIDPCT